METFYLPVRIREKLGWYRILATDEAAAIKLAEPLIKKRHLTFLLKDLTPEFYPLGELGSIWDESPICHPAESATSHVTIMLQTGGASPRG